MPLKIKSSALIFFIFLTGFQGLKAQTVYTLQQLIDKTVINNLTIQKAQNQKSLSDFEITRIKSTYLPTLNGNASHQYNFGRSIDRTTNQFSTQTLQNNYFQLAADMPLFNGFEKYYQLQYAKANANAQSFTVENTKNETILSLTNQYLQVILLKEREKQVLNQLSNSETQIKKVNIQFQAGAINKTKQLEAENQVATDNSNLVDIQNQISTAMIKIKETANISVTEKIDLLPISFQNITENISEADLNVALESGIKNLPAYKQAQMTLNAAGVNIQVAKANLFPRISLSGSLSSTYSSAYKNYSILPDGYNTIGIVKSTNEAVIAPAVRYVTSNASFGEQVKNNFGQNLGFNLSVPIFNGLSTRQSIKQAKIQEESSRSTFREAEQKAKTDIFTAYQNILNDRKKVAAATTKLNSNKELFRQSQINYDAGAMSIFDYNLSKSQLNSAENDYLVSKFQYLFDIKVFEFYQGKPLNFN